MKKQMLSFNTNGKVDWGKVVIVVIVIGIIVYFLNEYYKQLQVLKEAIAKKKALKEKAAALGISEDRLLYIEEQGEMLWNKGVERHWYTFWVAKDYNEEMFIATINAMVNTAELSLLDASYKAVSGESLKYAIDESFDSTDKAKLKTGYLQFLNNN